MASLTAHLRHLPGGHLLASAKAADEILAVKIPPVADKLRRLMNLAQITSRTR